MFVITSVHQRRFHANWLSVATRDHWRKWMAKITTSGERSRPVPHVGKRERIGAKTGSVARMQNCTTGFRGSGFTQERRARMITSHA
jgi:hypothetical protein